MKGYFYGLRGRQVYLILIGLVCTTLVIWASDKTSFLTSLLPPQTHILLLPREEVKSIQIVGENSTEQSENIVDLLASATSTSTNRSSYVTAQTAKNATTTKDRKQEVTQNFVGGMDQRQTSEESNSSRPAEKSFAAHVNSTGMNSSIRRDGDRNLTTHVEKRACNYAKGKWLSDDSLPLYSGFGCKQWLSGMWACRLTQRKDFEYEKLRWQPKDCEMEGFTAAKFLERMQNKTLAFVGDSLGRQQFQSLMCMVTGGEERPDVIDVGQRYGLVRARGAKRPDGWAYQFPSTNTTILYYWSASLCDLEPIDITNPVTEYAMHLDRPPSFLHRFIHEFDVLVLNTGHHWNRGKLNANRWVMYVGGVPNTNKRIASIGGAKNFTIYSIINWVNSQLQKCPGLKAFYRSISPRHFVNGDWNSGGSCDNTTPLSVGKEVSEDESRDLSAAGAVRGTKVKLLDITALSQIRDEGHISRYSITASPGAQDCLHWCLPGVPDTWNEVLFAQL